MDRVLLRYLPAVLAVARTRNFARAAAELGLGASAVSHAVRAAERLLGQPLFARTTRSVTLTEAGAAFVAASERALREIGAAGDAVRAGRGEIAGVLRINAPRIAMHMGLAPLLAAMGRLHPRLTVEVVSDEALVDIVAGGFDAGIRVGEMIARDMVAVRMTPPFRAIMVASPAFIAAHGAPASFEELPAFNCIGFRLLASGAVYAWELRSGRRDVRVAVAGTARVSDPMAARELALAGAGIAYVFEPLVRADLDGRRLVELLPHAAIEEPGLFLYFPRGASRAPKLRAFIDGMRQMPVT